MLFQSKAKPFSELVTGDAITHLQQIHDGMGVTFKYNDTTVIRDAMLSVDVGAGEVRVHCCRYYHLTLRNVSENIPTRYPDAGVLAKFKPGSVQGKLKLIPSVSELRFRKRETQHLVVVGRENLLVAIDSQIFFDSVDDLVSALRSEALLHNSNGIPRDTAPVTVKTTADGHLLPGYSIYRYDTTMFPSPPSPPTFGGR